MSQSALLTKQMVSGIQPGDPDNQLLRRIKRIDSELKALEGATTAAATVSAATSVQAGTHAQRLLIAPASLPIGSMFYETDRLALYIVLESAGVHYWAWAGGV